MMQAAKPGTGDHHRRRRRPFLDGTMIRCVLVESIMNSVLLEIGNILSEQTAQMALVQRDDMVEDLSASASDPTLGDSVLPGRLHARSFGM